MSSPTLVNDIDNDHDNLEQRHHHLLLLQHFDPTMRIPPPPETFLCRIKSHLRDAMVRRKHKRHLKQWMHRSQPIPYPPFNAFFPPPPPPPPFATASLLSPPPSSPLFALPPPFMDGLPMMVPPPLPLPLSTEPMIIHHYHCCCDETQSPINQVYNHHRSLPGFEKEEQREVHSS
ncbi:hypothetical protein O0I10_000025 [Lichtheimia ornata]|uniref:Uncharacterized protein n=1 Tax=Lichtheimia ornata TaxID=688661 RepID=A0AAD8DJM1_9FUNG|nr:uncharacterized protein O0I10_000025 [Lichtheimia ornata]KAJ8663752.1 hypothetical protein O0I10_000025 [Lichtheimia ornata]